MAYKKRLQNLQSLYFFMPSIFNEGHKYFDNFYMPNYLQSTIV